MSAKVDVQAAGKLDAVRWAVAGIILVASLSGFYYFSTASTLLRVIALLACLGIAVAIVSKTSKGRRTWSFVQDTHVEVRKVVWPSRQETIQTTLIVMAMVIVIALMIWAVDSLLFWIVQKLTT